jgi:poly(A) polymerase
MATPYAKALGVTPPLASVPPTAADEASNDELISELKRQNNYETPEETARR